MTAEIQVAGGPDAVPRARRSLREALVPSHAELVDDAAVVVTELVTNGLLHGRPPVALRVIDEGATIRIEVQDSGHDLPVLPRHSTEAMTGRGLSLVARLAQSWGVEPADGGGKVVWAVLRAGAQDAAAEPEFDASLDVDALLAAFSDDDEDVEPTFTVELGSVPTELLLEAKSNIDNVVREFTLEAAAARSADEAVVPAQVPTDLAELVATVVHGFAAARTAIKRQALAAAERGDREVRLSLTLPVSAADAGERYLAALDEADRYARNARLLSLETPPVHQVFRRWYVQRLVDDLRAAAAGQPAPPAVTFPERLGEEVTRLAPLEAQAARMVALQQVTAELTAAADITDIARTVVRNATEVLGAHSAHVYLVVDDELRSVASGGLYDQRVEQQYTRFPVSEALPAGAALLSGETVVVRDRAELLRRFPLLAGTFRSELSLLTAPLTIGEHRLGVLSVTYAGAARVEEHSQRTLLTTLADVTAQALERAMAADAARQATDRLQFLAEASVVLSSTLDYRGVLEAVARVVVPRLADWCSVQLLEDDGQLRSVTIAHVDPAKVRWARRLNEDYPTDMSSPTGAPNVLRTGVSEMYPDVTQEAVEAAAVDEEHLRLIREIGMSSVLMVPLTGRSGTFGVVTMIAAESGRRYDDGDRTLAEDLARRAALAVENAHAFREQSGRLASVTRVAEAAQHAILATPPASIGPVALGARYVSAAAEALVGGDLYEVVRRPGAVRLLIGDVRGKGLEAVRTATVVLGEFRSAAADLDDLVHVAEQVDRRLRDYLGVEDFVTALLAEIGDDGTFSIACCGHPPPLLVRAGAVETVDVVPTLPLGLGATPLLTTGRLQVGDRLLLYTDGILEARDPQQRFVELAGLVAPLAHGGLEEALDGVLGALRQAVGGRLGDDLALLVAEYRPGEVAEAPPRRSSSPTA
jgi:serine phosphatase RsbU (regulator of sigma subunit)/anti-sigma regulatory factor (Ser/Thr protein kinase)